VTRGVAASRFGPFDLRVLHDDGFGADAIIEHGALPPDDLTYFWTTLLGRARIEGHESGCAQIRAQPAVRKIAPLKST